MKQLIFSLAAIAGLLLARCAAPVTEELNEQILLPEIDVVQVKENADEALRIARETKLAISSVETKMAELDAKILLLQEEISAVSIAKIEEVENRLALLIEAYKDLQSQISAIIVLPQVKVKKTRPKPVTFNPSSATALIQTSPEYDLYHSGLRAFNSRNFEKALEIFQKTLEQFPGGSYTDNCHYWTGESLYALERFSAAINSFKRVFEFRNSSKADDALLKIGLCHLKLGNYGEAKQQLQLLVDRYPASEYVSRAKKYLWELQ